MEVRVLERQTLHGHPVTTSQIGQNNPGVLTPPMPFTAAWKLCPQQDAWGKCNHTLVFMAERDGADGAVITAFSGKGPAASCCYGQWALWGGTLIQKAGLPTVNSCGPEDTNHIPTPGKQHSWSPRGLAGTVMQPDTHYRHWDAQWLGSFLMLVLLTCSCSSQGRLKRSFLVTWWR